MSFANIGTLFTLISLVYVYQAYQLLRDVRSDWGNVIANPLTLRKKNLVERAAFLIAIPPSVMIHELFHAIVVWLFDGQVVGGGFFFFWGYVSHLGQYTPFENWLISFSGTVGSLLFTLCLWLALRRNRSTTLRYFGLRSWRLQILLSLIYYPVLTLVFSAGDWWRIYDFSATPLWSGLTAVWHVAMLIWFRYAEQQGQFEQMAFQSLEEKVQFEALETAVSQSPEDAALQLKWIQSLRYGGVEHKAQRALQPYLAKHPNSAEAHYEAGVLQLGNGQKIPHKAIPPIKKSIELGLSAAKLALAYQIIGQYHQRGNELDQALHYYNLAIETAVKSSVPRKTIATLYYMRGKAQQQANQFAEAHNDVRQALQIAQEIQDNTASTHYQNELSVLKDQINNSFQ